MVALNCDPYQTASLVLYGEWAHTEAEILCSFLEPGNVAVDVGANIGTIAIPMAKKVGPAGAVLAFEPQRVPFMCLCGNVALTQTLHQVRCFNAALSDNGQAIKVPIANIQKPFNIGGVRLDDPAYNRAMQLQEEDIPCMTLDQFDLPRLDMLKIDAECMEAKVLVGAANTLDRCRPIVMAEALRGDLDSIETANTNSMLLFLQAHRYRCKILDLPLFDPNNLRFCPDNIFPGGDRSMLAIPSERKAPDWFLAIPP